VCRGVHGQSLVKVTDGSALTSFVNTTEEETELIDCVATAEECADYETSETTVEIGYCKRGDSSNLSRGERVAAKLRDEHLNAEEKKFLRATCFVYSDVFYLPGDKLSCTNAAKHTIQLEPGVTAINTRPYPLPESQKEETGRQVEQLAEDGIIAPSESPWNSPLLIVPKKVEPDGKPKCRMVVDFRRLNDKTVGDAYRLPTLRKFWINCGKLNILRVWTRQWVTVRLRWHQGKA